MYGYTPIYYGGAVQVKYLSADNKYHAGVCIYDTLIDCKTGQDFKIDQIVRYNMARRVPYDDIIIELEWKPMDIGRF